jgi:hypothetical protein
MAHNIEGEVLIDAETAAELLHIELADLYRETWAGRVPCVPVGEKNFYKAAVLSGWINGKVERRREA